jgi:SPOR domain
MADRHQYRPFPAHDHGRGDDQHGWAEGDPLAELARLIGQTDPFASSNPPQPPTRSVPRERHQPPYEPPPIEDEPPAQPPGPPPWMQRANARIEQQDRPSDSPSPEDDYKASVHPLHRYPQPMASQEQYVEDERGYDELEQEQQLEPSRYDDALYGQIENGAQDYRREPAYPDDPYAYQDDDYEEEDDEGRVKRRGGLVTVAAVIALAVVGTGAAFAYRTYVGSTRSSEPPIIKADNTPTKVVPSQADNLTKAPDRLPLGDGAEKIVSREEVPLDINAKTGGPRVVFPPVNQSINSPTPASVAPTTMPAAGPPSAAAPSNGTLPNNEPRKIKTFSVRGDQGDSAAPVGAPPPVPAKPPGSAKATRAGASVPSAAAPPSSNGPMPLTPDTSQSSASAEARTRVATTTNPAPAASGTAAAAGGYLVQISSQRSESDAQASFKALQSKFPSVLGSQTPLIKRAELGDKGVYYRAMVGPFGTSEEAAQFCGNLKSAGGQCVVQKN